MFTGLVLTEFKKYKRTMLPWMIGISGFLTAGTALLMLAGENIQLSWETYGTKSLNCMNLLAFLLTAVFTGFVFVGEHNEGIINILFTYPVSRARLYAVKHLVIYVLVLCLYLTFFVSALFFGYVNMGSLPGAELLADFFKLTVLMSVMNFVLVPVTAVISNVIKGIGTYVLTGMSYFIVYMIFLSSDYSLFIPVCLPDKLVENYLIKEFMQKGDYIGVGIVSAITFLSAYVIGVIYYSKSDVYK